MMAGSNLQTVTHSDMAVAGSGFSFTGKLAEMAKNAEMVQGYNAVKYPDEYERNGFSFLWEAVSAAGEESGNRLYTVIRNYIDEIGNLDTCGLQALRNYARMLSYSDDDITVDYKLPNEILGLVEIFSVNRAYLYNKATDGTESTAALANTILHHTTITRFLEALDDSDKYRDFMRDVFHNTLMEFINLRVGAFADPLLADSDEPIWKVNVARFTEKLWEDDVTSEDSIYRLKEELDVGKSFTEKVYADKVISGEMSLHDFSDAEQSVLKAEIVSRQTRNGTTPQMRYYFMRLYKALEYVRFVSLAYKKIYGLEQYDLNPTKYTVTDGGNGVELIKFDYNDYSVDEKVVYKVAEWLADYSMKIFRSRAKMKRQSQKNMMTGTKRLIVDIIRSFLSEQVDSETWQSFGNNTLRLARLNKNFDVSIVEYLDGTEYFNIENESDSVDPRKYVLNPRYWEGISDRDGAFSSGEELEFYNKLMSDYDKFSSNDTAVGTEGNLYEFLSLLFSTGASNNVASDIMSDSQSFVSDGGVGAARVGSERLEGAAADAFRKFSGDVEVGTAPYLNSKNSFHSSYQIHPFVHGFEEYNEIYTSVMNLVNSFSDDITTSVARLSDRLSTIGATINFWYNWNEDFTGYSSNFEKGGEDSDTKLNQDGPFNFEALQEFINFPEEYTLLILQGVNKYYLSELTGKPLFTKSEMELELSRLQKYKDTIKNVAGKEIYKYAKDRNGNTFILYKDEGERNNKNALGSVWVRLRNHPLAFPLFDVANSPNMFTNISCLSETNNRKLLDLVAGIVTRFHPSYGNRGDEGYVELDNFAISFSECTGFGYYVRGKDKYGVSVVDAPLEYRSEIVSSGKFKAIRHNNPILTALIGQMNYYRAYDIGEMGEEGEALRNTCYYVDSVTNETITETVAITANRGSVVELVDDNVTGRILQPPDRELLSAKYSNGVIRFHVGTGRDESTYDDSYGVAFVDYSDTSDSDEDVTYSYTTEFGTIHPCSRRKIEIRSLYRVGIDALSGSVGEYGDVSFPDISRDLSEAGSDSKTEHFSTVIDGATVYEDFSKYAYKFYNPLTQSMSAYRYDPEFSDFNNIVMVGGSNPYYMMNVFGGGEPRLIKAERIPDDGVTLNDSIVFSNDPRYVQVVSVEPHAVSVKDCIFITPPDGLKTEDSIRQFSLRSNPYLHYMPYTSIEVEPTTNPEAPELSGKAVQTITFKNGGERGEGVTFYYAISQDQSEHEEKLNYSTVSGTRLTKTEVKANTILDGTLRLVSNFAGDYPIELRFLHRSAATNLATYFTYYSENDYKRFFDFGFSYDQKMMYFAYRNGSNNYLDSGIIIGELGERISSDFSHYLTYYRDKVHATEEVDPDDVYAHNYLTECVYDLVKASGINLGTMTGEPSIAKDLTFADVKAALDAAPSDGYTEEEALYRLLKVGTPNYYQTSVANFQSISAGLKPEEIINFYCVQGDIKALVDPAYTFKTYPLSTLGALLAGGSPPNISETYVASGDPGSSFTKMGESEFKAVSGFIIDTTNEYVYLDSLENYHYGDVESKNGIYSAFGKVNEHSRTMSLALYLFTAKGMVKGSFEIPLEFMPYDFGDDPSGKYSFSLNCTDNRLYLSFTCKPPHDDTIFGNAVAGIGGAVGSAKYSDISRFGASDGCVITILSFDISNAQEVLFVQSETRYLMDNGEIGYFPQFGGILGKNLIFTNSSLSANNEFAFLAEFDEAESIEDTELYSTDSAVLLDADGRAITERRDFCDFVYTGDFGFLVGSERTRGYLIDYGDEEPSFVEFKSRNGITSISRGNDVHTETADASNTYLFADGTASFNIPCLTKEGISQSVALNSMTVFSRLPFAYNTDFRTFADRGGSLYALHSDGRTVSRLAVKKYGSDVFPTDSWYIITDGNPTPVVGVPSVIDKGNVGYSWRCDTQFAYSKNHLGNDGTRVLLTIFVDLDNNPGTRDIMQFTLEMPEEYGGIDESRVTAFHVGNTVYAVYDAGAISGADRETYRIFKLNDTASVLKLREAEPQYEFEIAPRGSRITQFVDTAEDDTKVVFTDSQRCYKFTISDGCTIAHTRTWDTLVANGVLGSDDEMLDTVNVAYGRGGQNIFFGYSSDVQNAYGLLYVRYDTPDSDGLPAKFLDDGHAISTTHIDKILSSGSTVVLDDIGADGNGRLFVSDDDGATFVLVKGLEKHSIRLSGCTHDKFYATVDGVRTIYSSNGHDWFDAEFFPYSTWNAINASGHSYLLCAISDNGDHLKDRCLEVLAQTALEGDYPYDSIVVDDSGTVLVCSGTDGGHPMSFARSFADEDGMNREYSYFSFPNLRGIMYGGASAHREDLVLAPNGGVYALTIENAFSKEGQLGYNLFDMSSALDDMPSQFGGFVDINGNLVMYPTHGNALMAYNAANEGFYRFFSFPLGDGFSGAAPISGDSGEVILMPSFSVDGRVEWKVMRFGSKKDYAILEIDEGYPIMVTYVSFELDGKRVYKFTFSFMNDEGNSSPMTITTAPSDSDDERLTHSASGVYTVNNRAILYRFDASDSGRKFSVRRNSYGDVVETALTPPPHGATSFDVPWLAPYLSFDYGMMKSGRSANSVSYSTVSVNASASVYGGFADGDYVMPMPSASTSLTLEKFAEYGFTDTAEFYGFFNRLAPAEECRRLLTDSNFAMLRYTSVKSGDDMFANCPNAVFTNSLVLSARTTDSIVRPAGEGDSMVSANRMFKNCPLAKLPEVHIRDSLIASSESMFEGCQEAVLGGIDVPIGSLNVKNMFRNCRSALLDTVTTVNEAVYDFTGMFYGCESATLGSFKFTPRTSSAVVCDNMFSGCSRMDDGNLSLPSVSPSLKSADHMFYGAGYAGSSTFDNSVVAFKNLKSAREMFTGSHFALDGTIFRFGNIYNGISSISEWFKDNDSIYGSGPTVVLGGNDDITTENIEEVLSDPISGHYGSGLSYGITDFSGLYRNSSITQADLRGISQNTDLDNMEYAIGKQNFSSAFEGCVELRTVRGILPPHASTYERMFSGCSKLDVDISALFRIRDGENPLKNPFTITEPGSSDRYHVSSIAHMFDNCPLVRCSDSAFDLSMFVATVSRALSMAGRTPSKENFENAFKFDLMIAFSKPVEGLEAVDYGNDEIEKAVSNGAALRYASTNSLYELYGMETEYPNWVFGGGMNRFGGYLKSKNGCFFSIMYYPVKNSVGDVIAIAPRTISGSEINGLVPETLSDGDGSGADFYTFKANKLYAAKVFAADGSLIGYRYVGPYTKIRNFKTAGVEYSYLNKNKSWLDYVREGNPYSGDLSGPRYSWERVYFENWQNKPFAQSPGEIVDECVEMPVTVFQGSKNDEIVSIW